MSKNQSHLNRIPLFTVELFLMSSIGGLILKTIFRRYLFLEHESPFPHCFIFPCFFLPLIFTCCFLRPHQLFVSGQFSKSWCEFMPRLESSAQNETTFSNKPGQSFAMARPGSSKVKLKALKLCWCAIKFPELCGCAHWCTFKYGAICLFCID